MSKKESKKTTEGIDYAKRALDLRKHIINHNDVPVEEVPCPEWDLPFPIYVKTMTAYEKDHFEARQFVTDDKDNTVFSLENLRASLLVESVCADPEGKFPVFNGKDDVDELGKKSVAPIDRLLTVTRRLNGSTKEDEKNLVKNLKGRGESSGSNKPEV